jgi:hypothetical protein
VTIPLVGPAGPQGPAVTAGASAWSDITGKPATFPPSTHAAAHKLGGSDVLELDSQQILVDSVFLSASVPNIAGVYLHVGQDNGKGIYENAEYRSYFWWDSDLSKWFLANSSDVNLFESSQDTLFPWQSSPWTPISPQMGTIDVNQAQLFDISDQSVNNPSLLRTPKSGNATSTELVLGSDTRLTDARTPTSHTHGNLTNAGAIGTTSGLPVKTGTSGVLEAGAFGTAAGQFAEGNHTHAASAITSGVLDNARVNFAAPAAIGGTTAAAGSFTTLGATGIVSPATTLASPPTTTSNARGIQWTSIAGGNNQVAIYGAYPGTPAFGIGAGTSAGSLTEVASFSLDGIALNRSLILKDNTGNETATFDAQGKLTANRTYDLPNASGTIAINPMTTAGDIVVGGTSGAPARLALGTASQQLRVNSGATSLEYFTPSAGGSTNLWIPASAWIPKTTSGCGVDSRETTTNDQNFDELLFESATSDEFADALVIMPSNYNNGTITARFYWTAASGSGGVAWGIQGRAFANDDALDTAAGTAQLVTDTLIAANDMHITSATSAVTIGGTPAANTPIQFTIYRDISDAADTLGVDARLLGVEILFN